MPSEKGYSTCYESDGSYLVMNLTNNNLHRVTKTENGSYWCEVIDDETHETIEVCKGFWFHKKCKHIEQVKD